jgi:hypothetical protein
MRLHSYRGLAPKPQHSTYALGHQPKLTFFAAMSASPSKADIGPDMAHVCFGPLSEPQASDSTIFPLLQLDWQLQIDQLVGSSKNLLERFHFIQTYVSIDRSGLNRTWPNKENKRIIARSRTCN